MRDLSSFFVRLLLGIMSCVVACSIVKVTIPFQWISRILSQQFFTMSFWQSCVVHLTPFSLPYYDIKKGEECQIFYPAISITSNVWPLYAALPKFTAFPLDDLKKGESILVFVNIFAGAIIKVTVVPNNSLTAWPILKPA